ncbi:hypothetical protein GCM10009530_62990 [Microbispora corallina]|uniref:Cell division protein FtsK n=1 Tax=Microbispora corallina TaxID=83302 RepID=A0ABQ4GCN9_9ACTN|nr:hypothetical protein [Microbispora corallina]GIH44799.1 hypothetical protein Mco01_77990 [Microbispora corallina]
MTVPPQHHPDPAPAAQPEPPSDSVPAIVWGIARASAKLAMRAARVVRWTWRRILWPHRDQLAPGALGLAALTASTAGHLAHAPWWATGLAWAGGVAVLRHAWARRGLAAEHADALTGAAALFGAWAAAATTWAPGGVLGRTWLGLTAAAAIAWTVHPDARAWRRLRARCRNWAAQLPAALAGLGAAGVVLTSPPHLHGRRVDFPLRLPLGTTREDVDRLRRKIESGMGWPDGSIRDVRQDPASTASNRIVLTFQDGKIQARTVRLDQAPIPASVYDPIWQGVDDDGRDLFIEQYAPEGMTRGLYGGEPGSAKSNLLRLIAYLRAYCPDVLIWAADLKNDGMTFASILPRLDRLAVNRRQVEELFTDAATMVPARGRLLRPEDNQKLPLSPKRPAVLILFDEFATAWGKTPQNRTIVEAAKEVGSKGRAPGIGVEAASQYLAQGSLHPDLRPLFTRRVAGRMQERADAQFLLKQWNRIDTTLLPTGVFYLQLSGERRPRLLHTPEVTDKDLARAAAETMGLAPALEPETARELPHYANRWADLPDHLLPYCSPAQRELGAAGRAANVTPLRPVAAATPPRRVVVSERLDAPAADPALEAMCAVFVAARGGDVRTGDVVAAAAEQGRSRTYATDRLPLWRGEGLIRSAGRGVWRLASPPDDLLGAVVALEAEPAARRRGDGS